MFRRATVVLVSSALLLAGCATSEGEVSETTAAIDRRATFPELAVFGTDWLQQIPVEQGLLEPVADEAPEATYDRTIDLGFALAMMGDEAGASELSTGLIRSEAVEAYAGDGKKRLSARNTARVIANVVASGYNPDDLSGRRLVDELKSLQNSSGRYVDLGGKDTSDTQSQAWAVMAISAADEAPRAAVNFLTVQQCEEGGYPGALSDRPDGECKPDLESTALTISALLTADVDASAPEVDRAVQWLESEGKREPEGVFWTTGKAKQPDPRTSALVTIALVDAYANSGDALRGLRSLVIKEGKNAGAMELEGTADQVTTALGVLAFSGRGYSKLFI